MANLFSKDEDLTKSAPYIGAQILKQFESTKESRISIFDIVYRLKKGGKISNVRTIYYGMLFLYSLDIIEFEAPYLVMKC